MRKLFLFIFFLAGFNTIAQSPDDQFYFPAEWEEQRSVWLGWSLDSNIQKVHLEMAHALKDHVGLTVLCRSDSLLRAAMRQLYAKGVDTTIVQKYIHYIPNVFIRDAGPRFLKNKAGKFAIADIAWNNYGYPPSFSSSQQSDKRGEIDNALAEQNNWQTISSYAVSEGGAIDVSSDMMMCFSEMAIQRNPGMTLRNIEKEYLRIYGKKKMIWLGRMPLMDKVVAGPKAGNYFGYGANGHTDEFVRFANDSTILIGIIDPAERKRDPVSNVDHGILLENLEIIRKARRTNGKPFRIIQLPVPAYSLFAERELLTEKEKNNGDGRILFKKFKAGDEIFWLPAVSYLNFLISNNIVLVAKYWHPGLPESERMKDEKVRTIMQQVFPGRKIVQIDPLGLNKYGGGMHCATQQEPK